MSDTDTSLTWLTQEAHDRLKSELDYLAGQGRTEIAKKIEAARLEGDLRENGGYHAAREEQSKTESRITQLEDMLSRARVGEKPQGDGVVAAGMEVSVKLDGDDETTTFLLGAREVLSLDAGVDVDVYSPQSPLGAAILGKRKGDVASYQAPNGREIKVAIVDAVPYQG
jgi:transcription elongation factor GreA